MPRKAKPDAKHVIVPKELWLYRDYQTPYWQACIRLPKKIGPTEKPEGGKHPSRERFSTGEKNKDAAVKVAMAAYRKAQGRLDTGTPLRTPTLSKVALEWLGVQRKSVKPKDPHRFTRMQKAISRYFIPVLGNKDVANVSTNDIETLRKRRMDASLSKRGTEPLESPPTEATLNHEWTYLRAIFNYAVEKGYTTFGQMPRIRGNYQTKNSKPRKRVPFTLAEWNKISEYIDSHYTFELSRPGSVSAFQDAKERYRYQAGVAIYVLFYTGCRPGKELNTLRWGHVHFTMDDDETDATDVLIEIQDGKTGPRPAFGGPILARILWLWWIFHENKHPNALVFAHPKNTWLRDKRGNSKAGTPVNEFKGTVPRIIAKALGDDFDPSKGKALYRFRHAFATISKASGVRAEAICRQMGNSLRTHERHYDHTVIEDYRAELVNSPLQQGSLTPATGKPRYSPAAFSRMMENV